MRYEERTLVFTCASQRLLGIVTVPQPADPRNATLPAGAGEARCGLVVVVGGPQYRIGSHRQFLLLARSLAAAGFPALRFDHRGMGDADGSLRRFDDISEDIGAAIDALQTACPTVERIVLWGLCDAASAILLYLQARPDPRVAGLVLLNPWVRSETSLAQTQIKHYYGQRLLQGEFWRKLLSGRMAVLSSLQGLLQTALRARRGTRPADDETFAGFQQRMAAGWRGFPGNVLLILSGQDYTAKEFLEFVAGDPAWSGILVADNVRRLDIEAADHTFSSRAWRGKVEEATLEWLRTSLPR